MKKNFTLIQLLAITILLLIIFWATILISTILIKFNPQPTFKEVCEANNGTYIDNNGYSGDSCIYNK